MGEKLVKYYQYVGEELGILGKVKLAQETKIPSPKAAMADDSPEMVDRFKETVASLTGKPAPEF
jgi:hypothetical protein